MCSGGRPCRPSACVQPASGSGREEREFFELEGSSAPSLFAVKTTGCLGPRPSSGPTAAQRGRPAGDEPRYLHCPPQCSPQWHTENSTQQKKKKNTGGEDKKYHFGGGGYPSLAPKSAMTSYAQHRALPTAELQTSCVCQRMSCSSFDSWFLPNLWSEGAHRVLSPVTGDLGNL